MHLYHVLVIGEDRRDGAAPDGGQDGVGLVVVGHGDHAHGERPATAARPAHHRDGRAWRRSPPGFLEVTGATGIVNLSIIACLLLGIASTAILHSWRGFRRARLALWLLTSVLMVYTFLSILSIGTLLLPSVALALLASLAAIGSQSSRA